MEVQCFSLLLGDKCHASALISNETAWKSYIMYEENLDMLFSTLPCTCVCVEKQGINKAAAVMPFGRKFGSNFNSALMLVRSRNSP